MAAVIATTIRHRSVKIHKTMVNEPLSFHVTFLLGKDFVLPAGLSSVDVLRIPLIPHISAESTTNTETENARRILRTNSQSPSIITGKAQNLTSTKLELWTKKFRNSQSQGDVESAWQERLLIVTEKRFFIVTQKQNAAVDQSSNVPEYEIVDSIPMEEIVSIKLSDSGLSDPDSPSPLNKRPSIFSLSIIEKASSFLQSNRRSQTDYDSEGAPSDTALRLAASNGWRESVHAAAGNKYCQKVLRIATEPGGFNHGQPYLFLLRKQDRSPLLSTGGETARVPVIAREEVKQGQVKGRIGGERVTGVRE
jgi:hypothetical protein